MADIYIPPTITCYRGDKATFYQYGKDCGPIGYKTMKPRNQNALAKMMKSTPHHPTLVHSLVHLLVY